MVKHYFAKVEVGYRKDEIAWLRLVKHEPKNGVSIFVYRCLAESCEGDWWFEKVELALSFAEEQYGVKPEDWIPSEKLKETGIDIIEEE